MEITKQDLEWIVNIYPQVRQLGRVSKHIDAHIKCMSIVKGQHIPKNTILADQLALIKWQNKTEFKVFNLLFWGVLTNSLTNSPLAL